jgi:hypothetical protein
METWESVAVHAHANRGGMSAVKAQTGYPSSVLTLLWESARPHFSKTITSDGFFKQRERELWRSQHYFYVFLMYIHHYPTDNRMPDFLVTTKLRNDDCGGISKTTFYNLIMPLANLWYQSINLIQWQDRLIWDNHHVSLT